MQLERAARADPFDSEAHYYLGATLDKLGRKDEAGRPLDIVHRDVSPQNILLSTDGRVKIADFGIASANLFR